MSGGKGLMVEYEGRVAVPLDLNALLEGRPRRRQVEVGHRDAVQCP